jgi:serine protease
VTAATNKRKRKESEEYRPLSKTIAVRFNENVNLPYRALAPQDFKKRGLARFALLIDQYPGISVEPMITSLSLSAMQELAVRIRHSDAKTEYGPISNPLFVLLHYYRIRVPDSIDIQSLLAQVRGIDYVDNAYIEAGPGSPPSPNPRAVNQGYQAPAPIGVNAHHAWNLPGGKGDGINFLDVEQGWTLNHEDLVGKAITLVSGHNRRYFSHGTSVLCIVTADDNTIGGIGIAPSLYSAKVISIYRQPGDYSPSRADAITTAVPFLGAGDILLIEDQLYVSSRYLPVEAEDAIFNAILLATMAGIIVVEPAGNSNVDLDTVTNAMGHYIMRRSTCALGPNPHFRDSGAIMVAASTPTWPHDRALSPCDPVGFGSSYGSRIDCYAWGNEIDTCGTQTPPCMSAPPPDLQDPDDYTTNFGGTSGASAIIAGAALCLQGIAKSLSPASLLSPHQMRTALSNPATGTTSRNGACIDKIGVMPDLLAIIRSLGLGPDVYIRDNPMDNGDPSAAGPLSVSPDIIVLPASVADPVASFGEGSGTENSMTLGSLVQSGQDNFIYVRLKNRGMREVQNVSVTVYWSEVASLVTPSMWEAIGTINITNVPVGNTLVVGGPLTWPSANIPGTGHYCFVGVVDHILDPAPAASTLVNFAEFEAYIRNNNNVTWRNFNVVEYAPPSSVPARFKGFLPLPFLIVGAQDNRRKFDIEITRDLPYDAALILEAPKFFPSMLKVRKRWVEYDKKTGHSLISLPYLKKVIFDGVPLDTQIQHRCTLWVKISNGRRDAVQEKKYQYQISVSQLYNNIRVGRVSWAITNSRENEDKAPKMKPVEYLKA